MAWIFVARGDNHKYQCVVCQKKEKKAAKLEAKLAAKSEKKEGAAGRGLRADGEERRKPGPKPGGKVQTKRPLFFRARLSAPLWSCT